MSTAAPTKPRLAKPEVIAAIEERIPDLLPYLYEDRDWIWYCGPALSGAANAPVREALKEIGFRFSPAGHLMPDGETKGTWGHSCLRPTFRRRQREQRQSSADHFATATSELNDPLAALAACGL